MLCLLATWKMIEKQLKHGVTLAQRGSKGLVGMPLPHYLLLLPKHKTHAIGEYQIYMLLFHSATPTPLSICEYDAMLIKNHHVLVHSSHRAMQSWLLNIEQQYVFDLWINHVKGESYCFIFAPIPSNNTLVLKRMFTSTQLQQQ